ncbi:MAG: HAMP domain-containing sensor histidine kinase [Faecalibacterium sp.]
MSKQQKERVYPNAMLKDDEGSDLIRNEMNTLILRSIGEEFNRPLGLIANNCEYLQMHLNHPDGIYSKEKANDALADINSATLHLNRLLENFVEMTASLHGALNPSMQLVDLVSVLKSVCADSAEIYRAIGITLTVECEGLTQASVIADRGFAERICLNLLSNALHACTEGEHVVFSLIEREEGYLLTVTDDGYGFPPDSVLTAFMPCHHRGCVRSEGFERGGGMGLYLCGEYCRLMGWNINISLQEPGTKVALEIPRNEQVYNKTACFHASEYETQMQSQLTRMAVLRELRAVHGLEGLRR